MLDRPAVDLLLLLPGSVGSVGMSSRGRKAAEECPTGGGRFWIMSWAQRVLMAVFQQVWSSGESCWEADGSLSDAGLQITI
jgi:hypothetical protein